MNINEQKKNKKIKSLLYYLNDKYGENSFKISGFWDTDEDAIGLSDVNDLYVVYIANYGDKYFVSLEDPPKDNDFPYVPIGDYDNVDIDAVDNLVRTHLRLNYRAYQELCTVTFGLAFGKCGVAALRICLKCCVQGAQHEHWVSLYASIVVA
ncbi:MAG: hypothetical protein JW982_10510 [Spirochaetes bacterium]|nr:hypothetical protein [Spirochaetota bacterium]